MNRRKLARRTELAGRIRFRWQMRQSAMSWFDRASAHVMLNAHVPNDVIVRTTAQQADFLQNQIDAILWHREQCGEGCGHLRRAVMP